MSDENKPEKISSKWYLLPGFLGIIGAAIMYYELRDRNRDIAKAPLYITGWMIVAQIVFYGIMWGVIGIAILSNPF